MRVIVAKDYEALSRRAAILLAGQIIYKPDSVLGLATGSTPVGTYRHLVALYREGLVDFSQVVTFNLDEYYGLAPENQCSYYWFMKQHLFDHVNNHPDLIHIPDGLAEDIAAECRQYEEKIHRAGGIDLQLLGIGRNGHIGFNEPDLKFETGTHLVELDEETIQANARFFSSPELVPRQAISMGIKTIMQSKRIILLASGAEKANVVFQMIFGPIKPELPASILQLHPDVTVIADGEAASCLPEDAGKKHF